MAEEAERTPLENGERDEDIGLSSKENEKVVKKLAEDHIKEENTPKTLPQNWPRPQPRPPIQHYNPVQGQGENSDRRRAVSFGPTIRKEFPDPRAPPPQGVVPRRPSPWAVLRAKLPAGENTPNLKPPINEHIIQRMQNPTPPPQMRPPLSRPGSQESVRPPFGQRTDSFAARPPTSPRPGAPSVRPPSRNSLSKDEEDESVTNDLRGQNLLNRPPSGQKSALPPGQTAQQNQGIASQPGLAQGPIPKPLHPTSNVSPIPQQTTQNSFPHNQSPILNRQNIPQPVQNPTLYMQHNPTPMPSPNMQTTPPVNINAMSGNQNSPQMVINSMANNQNILSSVQNQNISNQNIEVTSQSPTIQNSSPYINQTIQNQNSIPPTPQNFGSQSQTPQHVSEPHSSAKSSPTSSGPQTPVPASPAPPSSAHSSVPPSPSAGRNPSIQNNLSTASPTPTATPTPPKSPQPSKQKEDSNVAQSKAPFPNNMASHDKPNHEELSKESKDKTKSNEPSKEVVHPKPPVIVDATLKRPKDLKNTSFTGKAEEIDKTAKENEPPRPESSKKDSPNKEPVVNGSHDSPKKSTKAAPPKKLTAQSPLKSPNKPQPKTPETPGTGDKKKLPMNKVQVGAAPSPNLKSVKSKIGSLDNAKYKPGGGHVKIEHRKLNFNVAPKIEAKNEAYSPGGGDKKIQKVKLQWNAKPKVGSLDNAAHKPGGGDKKIESVKLDFKDKAKPKVGSKDNIKHVAGGGNVKNSEESQGTVSDDIEDQKIEVKAESKIGSLDNVQHKPGGGERKIFDDKEYLKQMASTSHDSLNQSPMHKSQTDES